MATTFYGVNSSETVKLWARKLFHEAIGKTWVSKFMGTGSDSVVQILTDAKKDKGDRVRVILRSLLTGAGTQEDNTLEGNEEALTTYVDDVVINQLRHAVRSAGKMTEQRVPFSVREEARMGLTDWWRERLETSLANQMAGNADQTDTKYTGNNTAVAPSTGSATRLIVGTPAGVDSHTTEASLSATTTHAIKLIDLDRAVAIAKVNTPRLRPVVVDGKKYFVGFLHPYAIRQLRADSATTGAWFDLQKAQLQGGKISDNPLLTGAEFVYNGCIFHEWQYLPVVDDAVTSNTSYRRGLICGAQAAAVAIGMGQNPEKFSWEEELFDYGNQLGVSAGMIFGAKKMIFNSNDFGVITLSGYAPAP